MIDESTDVSYRSSRPDIAGEARRTADILAKGGVAIVPADVGYGLMASNGEAMLRMFNTKRRGAHKRHAMVGSWELHDELHIMTPRTEDMVNAITKDFDLPLGVISHYRPDHPVLRNLDMATLEASSVEGTMSLLLNAGTFVEELISITHAMNVPVMGSSANLTGTGTKFVVEDIQQEVRDIADITVDLGRGKYYHYRRSSTLIDFTRMEVVRIGVAYELISDIMSRYFGVDLPADPGIDALPSGHLRDQAVAVK